MKIIVDAMGGDNAPAEILKGICAARRFGVQLAAVGRVAGTLCGMYAASFLLSLIQSQIMTTVTQRTSQRLRESISRKLKMTRF